MKKEQNIKKVVLAYSGGLDTSVMIPWLKENYNNCEIIAVVGNVGQQLKELDGLEAKALKTGASKIYIENLQEELVNDFIMPSLKANAIYEGQYLLGTAFTRPLIAKKLVEIALKENADAICHGCTGKGNDQVRFEVAIKALAPDLQVIAPWRTWELNSREDEIMYAKKHNIPLNITEKTNYSKDENLWHLSHEGLDLENPANEPDYNKILELSVTPKKAPDKETTITIDFEQGIPTKLNGNNMSPLDLILALNKIGGENGIGILDMVEDRLVGMKSRGVYETPGGTILYKAHQVLETICLDKETQKFNRLVANRFGEILYNGEWYTPLRSALCAYIDEIQSTVTGTVTLKLYKGNIITSSVISPYSLYSEKTASFGQDDDYDQYDSAGFIKLYSLPTKIRAEMLKKNKGGI